MHAIFQPVTGPVNIKKEDLFKTLREIDHEFSFSDMTIPSVFPEAVEVYARLELEALIMGKAGPQMEENY
ncbi:hypothetical protein JMG10_20525 [Nostoc ellipsosporum NOK]|nr:hypothetical protein [Nostoc ellipsosporum NOK]